MASETKFKETEIGMIPEEWSVTRLAEVAEVIPGYAFKSQDFLETGVAIIKIKNIIPPNVVLDDVQYVSQLMYGSKEKYHVKYNDILISMTGSNISQFASAVGKVGRVKINNKPMLLNQRVGKIYVKNPLKYNESFLYHNISTEQTKYMLASIAGGSANQANIDPKQIKNLFLPLPPVKEQIVIGETLDLFYDKIELNNYMNKTLEEIAQTLFKRWFIDFEFPDENGNPYKSSGGRMVDSELGEIPEGWKVKSLYDCAQYINGAVFKSADFSSNQEGSPIIKISELKNGITSQTEFTKKQFDPKYRITNGEVLFSWSGSPDTSIDIFLWAGGTGWLNQHTFRIVPYEKEEKEVVFLLLKNFKNSFIEIARNKQTTGLGHVTSKDLKNMFLAFPSNKVIIQFNEVGGLIVNKIFCNSIESNNLSQTYDYLLPKLMSGKIRVEC